MSKNSDQTVVASAGADGPVRIASSAVPAATTGVVSSNEGGEPVPDTPAPPPTGQSLTLDEVRASGLDPAVYGYATNA